jgi:hypothetical protein
VTTVGREPDRIDIELAAGEPVDFTVPVLDAAGAAQDVSAWTVVATIRAGRGGTTLYTFTPTLSVAGVRLAATGATTAAWATWPVSVARWTLWVTPPGGEPDPLAAGWVRVAS